MFYWMQLASDIPHLELGAMPTPQSSSEAPFVPGDVAPKLIQALVTMLFDRSIGEVMYGR